MDKHFMTVAIVGVIVLGIIGVVAGGVLIYLMKDPMAGAVCLSIGSAALGTLGGVLVSPKIPSAVPVQSGN